MKRYLFLITAFFLFLSGCSTAPIEESTVQSEQKLIFSVVPAERASFLSKDVFGDKTTAVVYSDFSEINLLMDGMQVPFTEAIRDDRITVPEIFAYARLDARKGFCQESHRSVNGLTHFVYSYPECVLRIAYDIYETPDGKQHLMEELYFIDTVEHAENFNEVYTDEVTGQILAREDWGLSFEAAEASPTQITVNYSQQGGQQIGTLSLFDYYIYRDSAEIDISEDFVGWGERETGGLPASIVMGSSGQFTLTFPDTVGTLEPGDYALLASVEDIYDQSDVHPLMVNFADKQSYKIKFTVQ